MMKIVNDIFVLSPIIQGVLGSAFFWLILKIGAFLLSKSRHHYQTFSSSAKYMEHFQEYVFLKYRENKNLPYFSKGYFMCFNNALRNIVLGLFWISLGLAFVNTNEVFLTIGVFGGMMCFAKAITWLPDISRFTDSEEKANERISELEQLIHQYCYKTQDKTPE